MYYLYCIYIIYYDNMTNYVYSHIKKIWNIDVTILIIIIYIKESMNGLKGNVGDKNVKTNGLLFKYIIFNTFFFFFLIIQYF